MCKRVARFHALRRMRVNTAAMARAAATPAIAYGADVVGFSDTALQSARSAVASAGTAPTAGKSVDGALYALDADGGCTDPAFAAHLLPICSWALAVWQRWQPINLMTRSLQAAHAKVRAAKSQWAVVTGPSAALVVSAWRIGWTLIDATMLRDDRGHIFDCTLDPPAVIAAAVRRSVRRWRIARLAAECPQLLPSTADVGTFPPRQHTSGGGSPAPLPVDVVDCSRALGRLLRRKGSSKQCGDWAPSYKPDLISAVSNGQWPQTRLAATRKFTEDQRCQLCLGEPGTLWHRTQCPATTPAGGWQPALGDAAKFLSRMGEHRRRVLLTRGLVVVRIRAPPRSPGGSLRWLWRREDFDADAVTWYFDGSMFDGDAYEFIRVGFGLAAVAPSGHLMALAHGVPPLWVDSAPGAELWALQVVLRMCVAPPPMITDCKTLLDGLQAGASVARGPKRPNARTWSMVYGIIDDPSAHQTALRQLVWMPAHGTAEATVGRAYRSDGRVVTAVDWRANRLVDAAAKAAAGQERVSGGCRITLKQALKAAEYGAAVAGTTTHAANNLRVQVTTASGSTTTVTRRDSTATRGPTARMGRATAARQCPPIDAPRMATVAATCDSRTLLPNLRDAQGSLASVAHVAPTAVAVRCGGSSRGPTHRQTDMCAARREFQAAATWAQRLSHLQPRQGPSAAERMAALRERAALRRAMAISPP